MTLGVHPSVGQEVTVLSKRDPDTLRVELPSGVIVELPIRWTSQYVRAAPLEYRGAAVRLSYDALQELSVWVETRAVEKVAPQAVVTDKRSDDRALVVRRAATPASMVGKARASDVGGGGRRGRRGGRR